MFDSKRYGSQVADILALDGSGARLMPLAHGTCSVREAYQMLKGVNARTLFEGARAPEAALSGLYLYFSCLDEAHQIAQDIGTPDGSFWHGIMHRQEPDPGNAAYWFRRVGNHPIFPELREYASQYPELRLGETWDPFRFIDFCEAARRSPASPPLNAALDIQRREWQLLFDYCASPAEERVRR